MSKHNYTYNYGFLASWLAANPAITRRDVLTALQINDYKTLQNWTEGKNMMPLTQILRLCNAFSIPLDRFFCDMEAQAEFKPQAPYINTQMEPSGGWNVNEGRGGRHTYDPRTNTRMESIIPENENENGNENENENENENRRSVALEIAAMQKQMQDERIKYLEIISKQSDQIAELYRAREREHNKYGYVAEGFGEG